MSLQISGHTPARINTVKTATADAQIGRQVRLARIEAGWSQQKLGDALGITFQQVQKYELGRNRVSSGKLQVIAKVLKKPIAWFYAQDDANALQDRDIITEMLLKPHGLALAKAFLAIGHNRDRARLTAIAESIAEL